MSQQMAELKFTRSHEWVRDNGDGSCTVGITDHAQELLGDLVFVEPPEAGRQVHAGDACAVVESVKAASDVYAPLAGEVLEGNEALADSPELINQDAYGDGWIFRLRLNAVGDLAELMDADAYTAFVEAEG
ncbi:glycine cleavage system protein H [Acidihalobacter yilgarnensis]|uniref:Glycine cleavage system H protein n=1 Tax=Acidihalobacter yilgarnensis TaxID=2819280 RepID=A0A1D8IL42_9GAMM|nr:glycine cleavage system protein GcvH [Acidihalobacter yilgarnensis]AOU97153.1 glycine cleavage system protein H [Acidihalobacter yilgarnensis]